MALKQPREPERKRMIVVIRPPKDLKDVNSFKADCMTHNKQ